MSYLKKHLRSKPKCAGRLSCWNRILFSLATFSKAGRTYFLLNVTKYVFSVFLISMSCVLNIFGLLFKVKIPWLVIYIDNRKRPSLLNALLLSDSTEVLLFTSISFYIRVFLSCTSTCRALVLNKVFFWNFKFIAFSKFEVVILSAFEKVNWDRVIQNEVIDKINIFSKRTHFYLYLKWTPTSLF